MRLALPAWSAAYSHRPAQAFVRRAPNTGVVGDYEILEEIGHGGMGLVYEARQLGVNRRVALKRVLSDRIATPEVLLRFWVEAEAIASLDHPNIIPLYEAGVDEGLPFFTMKLVKGGSLAQGCARNGGPPADKGQIRKLVAILVKVSRAVHHAHQRGVLHRDLKPANILIDSEGEPYVTDFGLAKLRDSDITCSESLLGSPNYMAPEVAGGRPGAATTAIDIYGLGAVLYFMLTGAAPFTGDSAWETIRRVIDEQPVPPRLVNGNVDRDLEQICLHCLEKDPNGRYGSAELLAVDLEHWLAGEPVQAAQPSLIKQTIRWARRNPALTGVCIVAASLLAALAVGATIAAVRITAANGRAEALLVQMQLEQAERLMASGQSSHGLAMLAHVAERRAEDLATARRLYSALAHRAYAVPAYPPRLHGLPIVAAAPDEAEDRILTLASDGTLTHWRLSTGEKLASLGNPGAAVADADFTADAKMVAVATQTNSVEIWRTDGTPARERVLSDRRIIAPRKLAVDRAGQTLAIVNKSSDTVVLLSLPEGKFIGELKHDTMISGRLAFNGTGTLLGVGLGDGRVIVWDIRSGQKRPFDFRHHRYVMDVAFNDDGRLMASASADQSAKVWDLRTGKPLEFAFQHRGELVSVAFSRDDRFLMTGSLDNSACIWSLETGQAVFEPLVHAAGVRRVVPLLNPALAATVAHGGGLHLWKLQEPWLKPVESSLGGLGQAVVFAPGNESAVVIGAAGGVLREMDAISGRAADVFKSDAGAVSAVDQSSSLRMLAVAIGSEAKILKSTRDRWIENSCMDHGSPLSGVAFDGNGGRVVTASLDGTAQVWDAHRGAPIGDRVRHRAEVSDARFSPDGHWVVTASKDNTARIWTASTGELRNEFQHKSWVATARFSPDGQHLVTASYDRFGRIWRVAPGRNAGGASTPIFLPHQGEVVHAEFSPDGTTVVTASSDHTARLWAVADGKPKPFVLQHESGVNRATFSPDGKFVLTCSRDGSARLWSVATGQAMTESLISSGDVLHAALSHDSSYLATMSCDGTLKSWPLPLSTGDPARLCDLAALVSRQRVNEFGHIEAIPEEQLRSVEQRLRNGFVTALPTFVTGRSKHHALKTPMIRHFLKSGP